MSLETWVEVLVFFGAIAAGWLSLQRPASLDWERLWKTILATIIRGDVENAGGGADDWWAQLATVPYHPAGRQAYSKLHRPSLDDVQVPALGGERALVEALIGLDTVDARAHWMYREAEAASEALMGDPAELGTAYDPAQHLAPSVTWEHIAAWDATVQAAIARRLSDVVVAVLGIDATPLIQAAPHATVKAVDQASEATLCALLPDSHQRMVIIAQGMHVHEVLAVLHSCAVLRDRVVVMLSLGTAVMSEEHRGWMEDHFQHKELDTELNRRTLYMAITDGGEAHLDASDQRFPERAELPSGWAPIESVDLGPLVLAQQDPSHFARALWVLLSFCITSR
jgi:hypothetical protein